MVVRFPVEDRGDKTFQLFPPCCAERVSAAPCCSASERVSLGYPAAGKGKSAEPLPWVVLLPQRLRSGA